MQLHKALGDTDVAVAAASVAAPYASAAEAACLLPRTLAARAITLRGYMKE